MLINFPLSHTLVASHKSWFVVLCFIQLISLESPLWLIGYLEVCYLIFCYHSVNRVPIQFQYGQRTCFVWFYFFKTFEILWIIVANITVRLQYAYWVECYLNIRLSLVVMFVVLCLADFCVPVLSSAEKGVWSLWLKVWVSCFLLTGCWDFASCIWKFCCLVHIYLRLYVILVNWLLLSFLCPCYFW